MSILIKGMKMPENCYSCDLCFQYQDGEYDLYWICSATRKDGCKYERRTDCPLVEVPPHGRLIDADALERKAKRVATEAWKTKLTARVETTMNQFIDWVREAMTIIDAEGK